MATSPESVHPNPQVESKYIKIALLRRIILNANARRETQAISPELRSQYELEIEQLARELGLSNDPTQQGEQILRIEKQMQAEDVANSAQDDEFRSKDSSVPRKPFRIYWYTTIPDSTGTDGTPRRLTRRKKS